MVLEIAFPTTAICWFAFAVLVGSLRGRHRTTLVGFMLSAGLHMGSAMFKWATPQQTLATMPTWTELSGEAQLNIATAGIIGLVVILIYSFFDGKKE